MPFAVVSPVLDKSVRGLCVRPYPNHPRGCPNFNKKAGCPPGVLLYCQLYDPDRAVAVWNVFDLAAHVRRLRAQHPDWTQRQLECCLYWQGTARKALRSEIKTALEAHPGTQTVTCPEAMGVNVTATMASIGVELEWPPVNATVQVALLVYLKSEEG